MSMNGELTPLERLALTVPYNPTIAKGRFPSTNYRQRASVRRNARGKRKNQANSRSVKRGKHASS